MSLTPGTLVAGRYRIESALAEGGMGAVFVAFDEKFDERVALKIAGGVGGALTQSKARFKREARIGNRLGRVSGFVRAFDWGEMKDGFRLYLAMDLVEGGKELDLKSGSLRERLTRLKEAARLVAEAHRLGVIHRDLKPENFLQGSDGSILLADFGLGKIVSEEDSDPADHLTQSGVFLGTPEFMPPEQFEDSKSVDSRSDVYALGVMLFYALTGRLPYGGDKGYREVITNQRRVIDRQKDPPTPRDYAPATPPGLDDLCSRAIALDVDERLATAEEFWQRLDVNAVADRETMPPEDATSPAPRVTLDLLPSKVKAREKKKKRKKIEIKLGSGDKTPEEPLASDETVESTERRRKKRKDDSESERRRKRKDGGKKRNEGETSKKRKEGASKKRRAAPDKARVKAGDPSSEGQRLADPPPPTDPRLLYGVVGGAGVLLLLLGLIVFSGNGGEEVAVGPGKGAGGQVEQPGETLSGGGVEQLDPGDVTAPRLRLLRPTPGALTTRKAYTVVGTVEDAGTWVKVTVNKRVAKVTREERIFRVKVRLAPGDTTLRLSAVDAAGNRSDEVQCAVTCVEPLPVKEFKRRFGATLHSWKRHGLVRRLDPMATDARTVLLEDVLKKMDWYLRVAAIEVLADADDPSLIAALEKATDPLVKEGVILAFGLSGDPQRIPYLIKALASKKWGVRRAAAIALGMVPHPGAVAPLLTAWGDEELFAVTRYYQSSLERITRKTGLSSWNGWHKWWTANKTRFKLRGPLPEPSKFESKTRPYGPEIVRKEDKRVSGRFAGVEMAATIPMIDLEASSGLRLRSRGKGLPLLVLPELGYEAGSLRPYLEPLDENNQIIYIHLPVRAASFFPGPTKSTAGVTYYPLDAVVGGLEALVADLQKKGTLGDKFAILAHGAAGWISMLYVHRNPKKVRRQILASVPPNLKAWEEGRERLVRRGQETGDYELEQYGRSLYKQRGKPPSPESEEGQALSRKRFTSYFADDRDLEISRLLGAVIDKHYGGRRFLVRRVERPVVGFALPPFSLFKLDRVPTPTLVIQGDWDPFVAKEDAAALAKHYGKNARVITFKRSARMFWVEENAKFVEVVRRFLGGRRPRKKKGS